MINIGQNLVIGVGMDRGHHPRHHADFLVQRFDQRSETVSRTGGVGDDRIARLQHTVIDAIDNSRIHILTTGCGDDDLFCTPCEMGASLFLARKKPSALHHHINPQLGPGQLRRIPLGQDPDPLFTDSKGIAFNADVLGKTAVRCVILQQMRIGVGIPQMTALYAASRASKANNVNIIADGGITKSGDIVKALTLADAVICGGLLAGCQEAPGRVMEINGKLYKEYRGMGSRAAMVEGSAARYGHEAKDINLKATAEGVEALKEVSGPVRKILLDLKGGVQSGLGYLGCEDLVQLREKARYIRVSPAGQREAAPHDVVEIKTGDKSL